MDVGRIMDGIREFTGSEYDISVDDVLYTQAIVEKWLELILGSMVWLISIGMALITILDIAYIVIPTFREIARRKKWDGTSERTRARLISNDARDAVEQACTVDESSALILYLKKRLKTYILVTVIVFIMGFGMNSIVRFAAKIITGIIQGAS